MKSLLFLFLLFQMNAFGQLLLDKEMTIEFVADQDSFPNCRTLFYANGRYTLPDKELIEIEIPNTIPVNPSELTWSNKMIFHSFSSEAKKLGSLEFDEVQVIPYTREEVRNLILASKDSADVYWRIQDDDYLRSTFGIVYDAETVYEQTEVKTAKEESPIESMIVTSGIIDGVYIEERKFVKIEPLDLSRISVDYYRRSFLKGRVYIDPKLDSLFQPFYFSNYEVTNGEYREFVSWVRDSIELQMAYCNLMNHDAVLLLNCSKRERKKLDISKTIKNKERFGLSLRNRKSISDVKWLEATEELYYSQPERFYQQRRLNERKLIYRKSENEMIATYPDTAGFIANELGESMAFIGNMTWHPFYANYPVTNVSPEQIQAFCHWKQRKLNEEFKFDGYKITVRVPTISEYEFALKKSIGPSSYHAALDQSNDHFIHFNRAPAKEKEALFYTSVNYNPFDKVKSKKLASYEFMLNYKQWYQTNQSESSVKFLNGNVSEFVFDEITPNTWEHYNIDQVYPLSKAHFVLGSNYLTDVKTIGDDQYNSIFYKSALENGKSSPLIGFRLVYLVEKL